MNDGDLVVAAGTPEGWGVGVIAGTGSIAVARAPDGRKARAGGWGHLIGDEGSAYGTVLAALRKVARRADRRDPSTVQPDPLTAHLCRALGISGPDQLVSALYAPGFDRSKIAALAPAVLAAAALDPSIADELLRPAGIELAQMAIAAAQGGRVELGPAAAGDGRRLLAVVPSRQPGVGRRSSRPRFRSCRPSPRHRAGSGCARARSVKHARSLTEHCCDSGTCAELIR